MPPIVILILAIVGGCVLLGPLLEGFVRAVPRVLPVGFQVMLRFDQPYTQPDDEFLVRGIPHLRLNANSHPEYPMDIALNSLGYRDNLVGGQVYALVVGDSLVFGTGVELKQTFPKQLEALVGQPVAGMGIGGYSPLQYALMLEEHGRNFEPQVVLLMVFGDDLQGVGGFVDWRDHRAEALRQAAAEPPPAPTAVTAEAAPSSGSAPSLARRLRATLAIRTRIYRFVGGVKCLPGRAAEAVKTAWLYQLAQWHTSPTETQKMFKPNVRYRGKGLKLEFRDNLVAMWFDPESVMTERNWGLMAQAFHDAGHYADAKKAALIVLYAPTKEEAYDQLRLQMGGDPALTERSAAMRQGMAEICRREGIRFLDMTPTFQRHAQEGQQLWYPWDAHWNANGYRLAADTVFAYLSAQSLLPGEV